MRQYQDILGVSQRPESYRGHHSRRSLLSRLCWTIVSLSLGCLSGNDSDTIPTQEQVASTADWTLEPLWTYASSESTSVRWVHGGLLLPGARVLIGGQDEFRLVLLDSDGQVLRSFGRRGQGPGEIQVLGRSSLVSYRGDSVAVYDPQARRVSIFTGEGNFGRVVVPAPWREISAPMALLFRGALADGRLLFLGRETILDAPRGEVYRPREPLLAYDADGAHPEMLREVPGREQYRAPGARSGALALARETLVAVGRDGYYLGQTDSTLIQFVGASGEQTWTVPGAVAAPTAAEVRAERSRLRSALQQQFRGVPPPLMAGRLAYADEVPFPPTKPVFDRLVAGSEGELWVRLLQRLDVSDTASTDWVVLDRAGRSIGRARLPGGSEILAADSQRILVLHDAATEDTVTMYRVRRPR